MSMSSEEELLIKNEGLQNVDGKDDNFDMSKEETIV